MTYKLEGERLTFSTSVLALHTDADLANITSNLNGSGLSDNNTTGFGYLCGGYYSGRLDIGRRLTFSTSVLALHTDADLSIVNQSPIPISDIANFGYYCGGQSGGGLLLTTDRMTFSTSVNAAHTDSNLSKVWADSCGTGDGTFGYYAGGWTGGWAAEAAKMTFSTGVWAASTDAIIRSETVKGAHSAMADGNA